MPHPRHHHSSRIEKLILFVVSGLVLIVVLEMISLGRTASDLVTIRAIIGIGFFVLVYALTAMLFYTILKKVIPKKSAVMIVIATVTVLMIWFYSLLMWLGFFNP